MALHGLVAPEVGRGWPRPTAGCRTHQVGEWDVSEAHARGGPGPRGACYVCVEVGRVFTPLTHLLTGSHSVRARSRSPWRGAMARLIQKVDATSNNLILAVHHAHATVGRPGGASCQGLTQGGTGGGRRLGRGGRASTRPPRCRRAPPPRCAARAPPRPRGGVLRRLGSAQSLGWPAARGCGRVTMCGAPEAGAAGIGWAGACTGDQGRSWGSARAAQGRARSHAVASGVGCERVGGRERRDCRELGEGSGRHAP